MEDGVVGEIGEIAAGFDADGRRGRIEIAEVRGAGDVVDVMRFDRADDRGVEVARELSVDSGETNRRRLRFARGYPP